MMNDLTTLKLRINGEDNDRASGLVTAMDMIEHEEGLSTLELRFTNVAADGVGSARRPARRVRRRRPVGALAAVHLIHRFHGYSPGRSD